MNIDDLSLEQVTLLKAVAARSAVLIFLAFPVTVAYAGSSIEAECVHELEALAADTSAQWTTHTFDGPAGESSQGSIIEVQRAADGGAGAMTVTYYGEMGRHQIDYAISDIDTYKVTLTQIRYREPIYVNPEVTEKSRLARSFYVCDGNIVSHQSDTVAESINDSDEVHIRRLPQYLQQTNSRLRP